MTVDTSPDPDLTPEPETTAEPSRAKKPAALPGWQGDIGLLVLRLALATSFIGHGSQKVFGAFDGSGIHGFATGTLAGYGFQHTELLAWITGLTELVGGALIALGLLTPLAAAGVMAIMVNTVTLKFHNGFFFQLPGGYEVDFLLLTMAAALVLCGPGRVSLDAAGKLRGLLSLRIGFLVLGVAAGLAFYFLLRS